MSSPIAFDDTQFDLDLSDHLDQFPDGPAGVPATPARFDAVVPVGDSWGDPAAAETAEPVVFAATTVEDVPVPWAPAEGGTATYAAAVARAVDPPTSVHSVFAVTPPQGMPAVVVPLVPPVPPAAAAVAEAPRTARRRRRRVAVLAAVLAAGLVAGGAGLAIATNDGGDDGEVAAADAPGQSVALPPAGAEADKPDEGPDDPAAPGDAAVPPAADGVAQATEAVQTFLAVRGTDDERAVSSEGGRAELDAAVATLGRAVAQGDPACSAGADTATFTCVLDTDQGPITFTVGPDADDPQTSGFEVIGASAG